MNNTGKKYLIDSLINILVVNGTESKAGKAKMKQIYQENNKEFLSIVEKNVIVLRVYELIKKENISFSGDKITEIVKREKKRIENTVKTIGKISELLKENNINFVFTKSFIHYPDMGHDIDLLILSGPTYISETLNDLGISKGRDSLVNHFSGKRSFIIRDCLSPLEVHRGRLGHFGEYKDLAVMFVKNRKKIKVDGISTFVLSLEDQLILAVLQRIYSHRYLRISDIVHVVSLVKNNKINWDYVFDLSKKNGITQGLIDLIGVINKKYSDIIGGNLVKERYSFNFLDKSTDKKLYFKDNFYYFLTFSVVGKDYIKKIIFDFNIHNWKSLTRLACVPFLILAVSLRSVLRFFKFL